MMYKNIEIWKEWCNLKTKYITIILFILLLSAACSSSKNTKNLHEIAKKPSIDWTLEEEQTTFYKNVESFSNLAYYYDDAFDQEYLVSYNEKTNLFLIFDYNTAELISQFKIEHDIYSMYVHSIDSIFVCYNSIFGGKSSTFGLFNRMGKLIANYNMTQQMVISDLEKIDDYGNKIKMKVTLADNPYSFTNFCLFDNSLYLNVSPQTNLKDKFLYPSMAVAPLTKNVDKVYSYMFSYPKMYRQAEYFKADYMDFIVKKESSGITNIIISYTLSDSVEINRLVPRFLANDQSIFDTPEHDTLILKNVQSEFKGQTYPANDGINVKTTLLGFKYTYLKYDPIRNIYYRIAVHAAQIDSMPARYLRMSANSKAKETIAQYQSWSIIVTDSLLNKFEEKVFLPQQNYSPNILVTKDGLGIINYAKQTDSTGVNITKYKVKID